MNRRWAELSTGVATPQASIVRLWSLRPNHEKFVCLLLVVMSEAQLLRFPMIQAEWLETLYESALSASKLKFMHQQ
jgi:hypothetical protein